MQNRMSGNSLQTAANNFQMNPLLFFKSACPLFAVALLSGFIPAAIAQDADPMDAEINGVIAKANGIEIKRGLLDKMMAVVQFEADEHHAGLPANIRAQVFDQIINASLLAAKATPEDRLAGDADASRELQAHVRNFGSPEALDQKLAALGLNQRIVSMADAKANVAQIVLKRLLGVQVSEAEEMIYYNDHPEAFRAPGGQRAEFINAKADIKQRLEGQQLAKLAPAFLQQLRRESHLQILDASILSSSTVAPAGQAVPAAPTASASQPVAAITPVATYSARDFAGAWTFVHGANGATHQNFDGSTEAQTFDTDLMVFQPDSAGGLTLRQRVLVEVDTATKNGMTRFNTETYPPGKEGIRFSDETDQDFTKTSYSVEYQPGSNLILFTKRGYYGPPFGTTADKYLFALDAAKTKLVRFHLVEPAQLEQIRQKVPWQANVTVSSARQITPESIQRAIQYHMRPDASGFEAQPTYAIRMQQGQ